MIDSSPLYVVSKRECECYFLHLYFDSILIRLIILNDRLNCFSVRFDINQYNFDFILFLRYCDSILNLRYWILVFIIWLILCWWNFVFAMIGQFQHLAILHWGDRWEYFMAISSFSMSQKQVFRRVYSQNMEVIKLGKAEISRLRCLLAQRLLRFLLRLIEEWLQGNSMYYFVEVINFDEY